MRVLIADDSPLILDRINKLIKMDGVQILGSYNNGTDLLKAIKTIKSDLIISDIKMPGLTGIEVLNEIRKEDKKVNFIILTFYALDYFRQMAKEAGADYFFSKVDDFEEMARVVKELVLKEENYNKTHMINN